MGRRGRLVTIDTEGTEFLEGTEGFRNSSFFSVPSLTSGPSVSKKFL